MYGKVKGVVKNEKVMIQELKLDNFKRCEEPHKYTHRTYTQG